METWPRCLERLEIEFPPEDVHTWLKPLQADQRGNSVVLFAPNAFIVEQVQTRYLARIRELLQHFANAQEVMLAVGSRPKPDATLVNPSSAPLIAPNSSVLPVPIPFNGNLDGHYTFDNFVEGRSNQLGIAAAVQASQKPGDRAHNPVLP